MKKRRLLIAVILVLAVLALTACGLDGECAHEFGKWAITQEGNCAAPGIQTRQCAKCGYTETEEIKVSAAHKEEIIAAVAPSCTESGLSEGKRCAVCYAELLSQQIVPATGHTEVVDAAVAATCDKEGLTEGKHCAVCDTVTVAQETVPTLGHTEVVDAAVAATCTQTGLTEGKHCSVCQAVTLEQQTISATGHTEVTDAAVAPSCTAEGLTEGKHCAVCNEVLLAQTAVAAVGHKYAETLIQAPACNADGTLRFLCETCGDSYTEAVKMPAYSAVEIHNMAAAAVGEIHTFDANGNSLALGSCFVYSSDGTIVTNYHVIEGACKATVTINNVTYGVTQVLAYSPAYDLAVLKIEATGLTALPICANTHAVGETVYAFGSSQGLTATFSQGIISHAGRMVDGVLCVQHDAAISSGNSGGPLINRFGEIIGINTFYISNSQNLNFAVSVAELSKLDYSTPMTLEQVYKAECSAYNVLKDYVLANGTYDADDNEYLVVMGTYTFEDGDKLYRYVKYDVYYNEVELCIQYNDTMLLVIYMNEDAGLYEWSYVDTFDDYMYGEFDPATYVYGEDLTYTYYELNDCETPEELLYFPSTLASYMYYFLEDDMALFGLTPADLGFIND